MLQNTKKKSHVLIKDFEMKYVINQIRENYCNLLPNNVSK